MDTENRCRKEKGAKPIIDSLKEAQVSDTLVQYVYVYNYVLSSTVQLCLKSYSVSSVVNYTSTY